MTATLYIPPLEIELSDKDNEILGKVVNDMVSDADWEFTDKIDHPWRVNNDIDACAKLDKIIEKGVDVLREHFQADFIDKLYFFLIKSIDNGEDDPKHCRGMLTMRVMDTIKYVLTVTEKYRGKIQWPIMEKSHAKKELTRRGLWKQPKSQKDK